MPTFSIASLKINELSFSLCLIAKVRLEKQAPESSQLVATLRSFAAMLQQAKRGDDGKGMLSKAQKIADHPVSKAPEP